MKIVFSTDKVHPRDRFAYWREEASKAFVMHDFSSSVGRSFRGVIRAGSLDVLSLALFESDAAAIKRTQHCVRQDADDDLLVCMQTSGGMIVHQDGRDAALAVNDMVLIDPRRPFSLSIGSGHGSLVAKVPREELRGRLGDVTSLTARAISNQEPAASLASGFLGMLPKHIGALNGQIGAKIAQQVLDLVALAFAANAPTGHVALSSRRTAALLHLKVTIEGALGDHSLRPVGAAAAAGISVPYANALLAEEGTSLERFIVSRRLQRCHQTLSDPAQAHRTVSDIAYSYGFSDRHTSLAALKLNSVFCRVSVDRKRRRCFKECLTRSQRASNLLALLEFVATILAGLTRPSSMQAHATHELVCKHAICKNKRGNQRLSARRHSSHCPGEELWRPVILSAPPRWGASILPRGTGGG